VNGLVSADWVLPVDGPPIRDGHVAWENGAIVEVAPGRSPHHHSGAVIVPGIVNAHSHIEYAVYGGFADGRAFPEWLSTHIARKRRLEPGDALAIARFGAAQLLASGVTTTADFSYSGAAASAAAEFGLRAIVYLEVFGSDPATAAERFDGLRAGTEETELVSIGISPHAPYTCSLEVYEWALARGLPVGTHLAESEAENDWLERGGGPMAEQQALLVQPTGRRSVATLAGLLGPELLCVHCVAVDTGEIAVLAERDVPVVHCPRSNAVLGCGTAPLASLRAAGVRVGLGTDSPASTPSLDPWEEMRQAIYAARSRERRPEALSAGDALALATLGAAGALGLADEVGSLTPGKRADLTVVSVAGTPYDPVDDPVVAAVFGGSASGVVETIVNGEIRYRQGETAWHEVRSTASAARARMLG
jgi:cytosine/adenosine deaminase-related metal-dependent hydrolase